MAGKLLILSFHGANGPGVKKSLLGEDLLFKQAAIASGLVAGDAMDEPAAQAALDRSLFEDKKAGPASGLERGSLGSPPVSLVGLNKVGLNAWLRPPFRRRKNPDDPKKPLPSLFETWLQQVFTTPVDVLVLAGHHWESVVWGAEDVKARGHRWLSALKPSVEVDSAGKKHAMLGFWGHKLKPDETDRDVVRAGPFDLTAALRRCRLLVILGCNGATAEARGWRDWVTAAAGTPPFLLGWYGIHSFPTDQIGEHFSSDFWTGLKGLAPGNDLEFLRNPQRAEVIAGVWASALEKNFSSTKGQRHLLFSDTPERGIRGAGAIDPSGRIWKVVNAQGKVEAQP